MEKKKMEKKKMEKKYIFIDLLFVALLLQFLLTYLTELRNEAISETIRDRVTKHGHMKATSNSDYINM